VRSLAEAVGGAVASGEAGRAYLVGDENDVGREVESIVARVRALAGYSG
jgi:hypothetical protein